MQQATRSEQTVPARKLAERGKRVPVTHALRPPARYAGKQECIPGAPYGLLSKRRRQRQPSDDAHQLARRLGGACWLCTVARPCKHAPPGPIEWVKPEEPVFPMRSGLGKER